MTQPASLAPDKCCAAERLSGPARRVHLAVLAAFTATGQPPPPAELDRLARAYGGQPGPVLAELTGADLLAFTADGQIRAAYPFSPAPTAIQVSWSGGPQVHAMCAIDALGMSAMLGHPVTITAAEPGTGRTITVVVNRDRARWKPRTAVVFAGAAAGANGPAADRSCGYINFFTTTRAAQAWARRYPDVTGTLMRRDGALKCGIAEFGALLQTPPAGADRAAEPE
jgi:alkylmercury lyase-like protein